MSKMDTTKPNYPLKLRKFLEKMLRRIQKKRRLSDEYPYLPRWKCQCCGHVMFVYDEWMSPDLLDVYDVRTSATDQQWAELAEIIDTEDWKTNDHSTTQLLPTLPSTRIVMAVRKSDDSFMSAVLWNEVDDLAMIAYYITKREERGKGLGSLVWSHAMECIDKESRTIVLRTGVELAPMYQREDLPVVGKTFYKFVAPASVFINAFTEYLEQTGERSDNNNNPGSKTRNVNELSIPEFDSLLDFDQQITGRDRSDFLDSFFSLDDVCACVTQDSIGAVNGYGAIVPTLQKDRHLYRLAPVFAPEINTAMSISLALIKAKLHADPEAQIILQTVENSAGATKLHEIFDKFAGLKPVKDGITLSSKKLPSTLNMSSTFVPHNNCGHYDV